MYDKLKAEILCKHSLCLCFRVFDIKIVIYGKKMDGKLLKIEIFFVFLH